VDRSPVAYRRNRNLGGLLFLDGFGPICPPNTPTCRHSIHSATAGSLNPELGQVKLSDLEIRSDQFLGTGQPSEDELAQIVRNNLRFPQARCHLRGDVLAVLRS
jgi:hypothetical protein